MKDYTPVATYAGYLGRGLSFGDAVIAAERFKLEHPGCTADITYHEGDGSKFRVTAWLPPPTRWQRFVAYLRIKTERLAEIAAQWWPQ